MDEETVHAWEERPDDDADFTWHENDNHWGYGINCDDCRGTKDGARYAHTAPMVNIRHLKRQNELSITAAGEEREAIGDRWNDEKIGRA